jgi:hypothetical protein
MKTKNGATNPKCLKCKMKCKQPTYVVIITCKSFVAA